MFVSRVVRAARPRASPPRSGPGRRPAVRSRPPRRRSPRPPRRRPDAACSARSPRPSQAARAARSARGARRARGASAARGPGSPRSRSSPARWQSTNACGAEPWIRPSVTPEYAGCRSAPCPSTQSTPLPRGRRPRRRALGGAGDEVRDDRVDGDPPAGDRDPGLAGRHEHRSEAAALRLAVELERDGHLPDRAVGADREDDPRGELEVRAGRDVQTVGRLAQVAQLDTVARRELDQLGVVLEVLVQAVLDVEPCCDAAASGARARRAGSGRPGWRRRRAPSSGRRRGRPRPCRRSGCPRSSRPRARSRRSPRSGRRRSVTTPRIVLP